MTTAEKVALIKQVIKGEITAEEAVAMMGGAELELL